jgi:hypothetical protein
MNSLAIALAWAIGLTANERNSAEVDRLSSDLIELSSRQNFVFWLAIGIVHRGWARSVSGNTGEGIAWIEQGIRDYRETGAVLAAKLLRRSKRRRHWLKDLSTAIAFPH